MLTGLLPEVKVDKPLPVLERQSMPHLPVSERISDFNEVELGLSEDAALKEAARCLDCGLQCYG
jgi:hypothetical protein